MNSHQLQALGNIGNLQNSINQKWVDYWHTYSWFDTWQVWFAILLLIVPLIVLFCYIDRTMAFRVGFYGFAVHIAFTYIDAIGTTRGYWMYPFKALPWLPTNFSLDVSFVPVVFMLVYQWVTNRGRNYYLYMSGVCLIFAFVIKPLFSTMGLFQMFKGMNYFYLLLGYVAIMLVSKWITNLFGYFERSVKAQQSRT